MNNWIFYRFPETSRYLFLFTSISLLFPFKCPPPHHLSMISTTIYVFSNPTQLPILRHCIEKAQCVTRKKPRSQEVGEDSKLARSFERIRSIVRRRRLARKEKKFPKLEQIVNDVLAQQIDQKKRIRSSNKHYLTVEFPQKSLYRHSYQVISCTHPQNFQ